MKKRNQIDPYRFGYRAGAREVLEYLTNGIPIGFVAGFVKNEVESWSKDFRRSASPLPPKLEMEIFSVTRD